MGLFGRKKKEPEKPKEEKITFDSSLGTFYYINNPPTDEFGYECYIDLAANGTQEQEVSVYIDADTPDTTQAGRCYARLEELVADWYRVSYEISHLAAGYFMRKPGMFNANYTEQMLAEDMRICCLGVFRNGDTQFSLDTCGIYADMVSVTRHADGSKDIEYISMDGHNKTVDKL